MARRAGRGADHPHQKDKRVFRGTSAYRRRIQPIGRAAIREPEGQWWVRYGLGHPDTLLKLFAARSNCLIIVDRAGGLAMRDTESALRANGDLRRGSNIGGGQVAAVDFFIIPDLANSNANSGGDNLGAVAGSRRAEPP